MTGEEPPLTIDHVNTCKADNRWVNLRAATHSEQNLNQRIRKISTSGRRAVYPSRGKWQAQIQLNGRKRHLGIFPTREAASAAYEAAARELHGEFYRPPLAR